MAAVSCLSPLRLCSAMCDKVAALQHVDEVNTGKGAATELENTLR